MFFPTNCLIFKNKIRTLTVSVNIIILILLTIVEETKHKLNFFQFEKNKTLDQLLMNKTMMLVLNRELRSSLRNFLRISSKNF